MCQYFINNEILNTIFHYTDPEIIANILINEISIIINCIAPAKKVQCNTKYAPWIDDDFIIQSKLRDDLHKKAKLSDSQEDWRQYRSQRNIANNLNKNKKYNYLKHQLNISKNNYTYSDDTDYVSDKIMWKNVKNITSNNKQVPPRAISHNRKLITSIK